MTLAGRAALLLLLFGCQEALAPHLRIAGVLPDLPLVAVLVTALARGPVRGGTAGLVVGLITDLLRGTRLGLFALAAGAAGWVCGEAASRIDPGRASVRFVLAAASALVYGLIIAALAVVFDRGGIHVTGAAAHALGAALYDGMLATVVYGLLALRRHNPLPMGTRPLQGWRTPLRPPRRQRPPQQR